MSNTDGERIAPVTYLFGAKRASAQPEEVQEEVPSPPVSTLANGAAPVESAPVESEPVESAPVKSEPIESEPRVPMFVDLGAPDPEPSDPAQPEARDQLAASVRAELEREARTHVERERGEAAEPARKGSFAPINNVSMHALARRGMSSREMRDYLRGREFEAADVDVEVERLESVALLDDVALGETLVRTLRDRKGLGRSALTAELRRRNLDQTAIEIALGGLDDDELERATEIAHKRASQLRSYDAETAKRRLGAFLMRKGYSGSVVSTAMQRALAPAGPTFR